MRPSRAKAELRVIFDTSVLFTQVAYDLVRNEVKKFIQDNSKHTDLAIRWYFPNMVIDERRYQMQRKAFELLSSVEKIEILIGHRLNITEDLLKHHVGEAIKTQLEELGISSLDIDTTKVDWKNLISRCVYRQPPFEQGQKEKGFRDSLIAESFLQLVRQSPSTPSVCRLVFITDDELLSKFVMEHTKETKNVRVLSNIGELESLINTLVSQVTEEFVTELTEIVSNYFFEKGNDKSLFYKEQIRAKIADLYDSNLKATPKEGQIRENGAWWIGKPVFVKKEKQRICWITPIKVDAKIFKLIV